VRLRHLQIVSKRESQTHELKGETLKINRAILALHKATIIPMVRWSFISAGFRLSTQNLLAPVTVTPADVLARIAVPEVTFEEDVFAPTNVSLTVTGKVMIRSTIRRFDWMAVVSYESVPHERTV
jgi:hypothetical protein